ncbi:MAG: methyltransferase domain-containing protein [Burkholderiaceae bacterium]
MVTGIPWWGKIGAKIILSRISFGYAVWQRLGLFRHGQMDSSEYAIRVFNSHIERSGLGKSMNGRTLLELGPGDSIASAIIAKAYGARAILVDAGAFVRSDIAPYVALTHALTRQGLAAPDLSGCVTIDDILNRCEAQYLTTGLEGLIQLKSESVDLIFSQAVLEHIRRSEFLETMQQCYRILKSDGICSHQIDLRDHLGGGLNNLRFSERIWESHFFTKSGFYTNRIQYTQMQELFRHAGFQVRVTATNKWESLPIGRNKLFKTFKVLPDEELCISGFDVILH